MTLIQDAAINTINEKGFPIILIDNDQDSLGLAIERGLKSSSMVFLQDKEKISSYTEYFARKEVAKGSYILGIVIPKGATENIRLNTRSLVKETMGEIDSLSFSLDSINIKIFIDPVARKSLVNAVVSNLHEFISSTKSKIMFQTFSNSLDSILPSRSIKGNNSFAKTQNVNFQEIYASEIVGAQVPNAVQHNVPAWTIFGMFFIVISIVGSLIKEKKEGSFFRLNTIPTPYFIFLCGKVTTYVMLNMIQFFLMISVGYFFLPMIGMPMLDLGDNLGAILILAFSTSLAATGFGIFVGTVASSEQQGAILGSLAIILLSAIGGILVPTYIMPELMRKISIISPLNWSLEGMYKVIFRTASFSDIAINVFSLLLFFVVSLVLSIFIQKTKNRYK